MMTTDKKMKLTSSQFPEKVGKTPLKRSMSGYETEMFVIDNKGRVDNTDRLLKKAKAKKINVQPECAKGMIEVVCTPNRALSSTSMSMVENLIELNDLAVEEGFHLYPFATYPGNNEPQFRNNKWYTAQRKILGSENFDNAGKCTGYHQHYALPWDTFDHRAKFLKYKKASKIRRTLIDSYNMMNALDPVLTLFLQSSPYVDNQSLAKDSRMVLYRSGKKLKHKTGVYAKHQFFGGLSPYKQTLSDLISTIKRRHVKWRKLLIKNDIDPKEIDRRSVLEFSWNPVKINKIGTLEYRGGDMNYLSNVLGVATMIKFTIRKIQQDFMIVMPADIEVGEAFTVENNMVFIPPHSVVRKKLQYQSAHKGFESKDLYDYSKAYFKFARKVVFKEYRMFLSPIQKMIDERKSMSDRILERARKDGYNGELTEDYASKMALHYSQRFGRDLSKMHEMLIKRDVD